jgi:hypothetical protein
MRVTADAVIGRKEKNWPESEVAPNHFLAPVSSSGYRYIANVLDLSQASPVACFHSNQGDIAVQSEFSISVPLSLRAR